MAHGHPVVVRPENPNELKFLTFALAMIMLEQYVVWYPSHLTIRSATMPPVVSALLVYIMTWFRSRRSMQMEILALRHQVAVYQQTVSRPRLRPMDRLLWAWLSRVWPSWQDALEFVQPHTVVAWRKKRFRDYWRRLSQHSKSGRATISPEVRTLIPDMWQSNPMWGSPRIVGELEKLGIHVAKLTVEKYRPRFRRPRSPTWKPFLKNHVKDLVSCDFFTVPTVTHKVLFVFVILAHDRRRIVHFNVTEHPTATWTAQQLVEAFSWDEAPRYLLRDREAIYGAQFHQRVSHRGIKEVQITPCSPWQKPYVERLIGSIRRECLNEVIVLNKHTLRGVLRAYMDYYHTWRVHRSLDMDAPSPRPVQLSAVGPVRKLPEVGGLHHHYERLAA
jgi:putative transposase